LERPQFYVASRTLHPVGIGVYEQDREVTLKGGVGYQVEKATIGGIFGLDSNSSAIFG
jgi:hypothetical protein